MTLSHAGGIGQSPFWALGGEINSAMGVLNGPPPVPPGQGPGLFPPEPLLQAQAETGMRYRAVTAEIEVPPILFWVEVLLPHPLLKNIESFFALTAADNFAHPGNEHVHGPHGAVVVVDSHVEGFDLSRIVVKNDRTLKMLFGEIPFVLGLQVVAPRYGKLETAAALFQDLDGLGVR